MIKVKIGKTFNKYASLKISGHSNYDEYGKDIVCAGVSAIATGGLNALLATNSKAINYKMKDGFVDIDVLDTTDDNVQLIIETIVIQLKTIEESYKKNIKIEE